MIKNSIVYSFCMLVLSTVSFPQGGGLNIGNNYRIFPSSSEQTEVLITKHPINPNILFTSANTIKFTPSFFVSEGVYVSTDAGNSWFGSDTCDGANIFFHGGDPAIAIDKNGTFILTRKGTSTFPGVYSHFSLDNGLSWSNQKTISTDELERATMVTDTNSISNYYGRTYTCWAKLNPPYSIGFSYTDDGAKNWVPSSVLSITNIRRAGGEIKLGASGEIYVCWAVVSNSSPFSEVQVGFASSNNGGVSWNINENAFQINGIIGVLTDKQSIRVNGLPRLAIDNSETASKGTIYIVTSQKNLAPAGTDPDIVLRKSTDSGQTWSDGIRVNQDAINNGKYQFFPGITVDKFGAVNIIFYDDRNTTSDSLGLFLARSTDGGNTWNEYEISDNNFRPVAIGGLGQGYMGDNIDLTSVGNKLYPVWMDNRSGNYQIWTTQIEIESNNTELPPSIVEPILIIDKTSSSFKVEFRTLRNGNSQINYGLTTNLEIDSIIQNTETTSHSLEVTGLNDSTLYYFQLSSTNNFGTSRSKIQTVLTNHGDTFFTNPVEFELKQNYPNPFNPATSIEFSLPYSTHVVLKIYDITGKEIITLVNEVKSIGKHKINFNAGDYKLSSGVYYYTLTANGFTQTKPMMLLK